MTNKAHAIDGKNIFELEDKINEFVCLKCKLCGKEFVRNKKFLSKKKKLGYFCSVGCSNLFMKSDEGRRILSENKKSLYKLGITNSGFKKGNSLRKGIAGWCKGLSKETDERIKKFSEKNSKTMKRLYKDGKRKSVRYWKGRCPPNINNPNALKINREKHILMWKNEDYRKKMFAIIRRDTLIERKIQKYLGLLGLKYKKQKYIEGTRYICDFFIPKYNLIIECDGDYWHGNPMKYPNPNEWQKEQIKKDWVKNKSLLDRGYNLMRIWEWGINEMNIVTFEKMMEVYNGKQSQSI